MKKLFLLWIFSGSLDSFSQPSRAYTGYAVPAAHTKIDTVRASLLITSGHMQIAHCYEGYVVTNWTDMVAYLDDKKRPFKAPVRVWGVIRGGKP